MNNLLSCALVAPMVIPVYFGDRDATSRPPELGAVRFGRDLDLGLAEARRDEKLVFLLFQEIPGCSTCKGFGAGPLSNPLLAEAIESEFVPVAIYNNREGADKAALERFGEPAWNNPVVRFLDADGRDVLPRADGLWTEGAIAARMVAALGKKRGAVPDWLALASEETEDSATEQATFAMHCYWEGQGRLGSIAGVEAVEPGFVEGEEVVRVTFRPQRIAYADLVRAAERLDCSLHVYTNSETQAAVARGIVNTRAKPLRGTADAMRKAAATEHLYHLQHSSLRFVPMTELQATRINADLSQSRDPSHWLSPRQRTLAQRIAESLHFHPDLLDGLERPARSNALPAYTADLEARLSRGK
jgi:hypothetical protein